MSPEELGAAVEVGDIDRVVTLVVGAPESDRRAAAAMAVALQKRFGTFHSFVGGRSRPGQLEACRLALLGTGTATQIRAGTWMLATPRAVDVLAVRPPEILEALAPWLVGVIGWKDVRQLVLLGAMPRPDCDEYILGMLAHHHDARELLRDDPALLELEVWRLFEIEGTQQLSLADHDKYTPDSKTWATVLLELSATDRAARARLLDASLSALERDFPSFRAGWFSRFHEALRPTVEERAARAGTYLRLLRSPIAATVALAVAALGVLQEAGLLDADQVLPRIEPAMAARAASTARAAVRLVDRAARAGAPPAATATAAAAALAHPSADVQAAALGLLERITPAIEGSMAPILEARRDDVALSLRPRFEELRARLGSERPDAVQASPAVAEPGPEAGPARPPMDPFAMLRPVVPVASLPELVEVIARVLEQAGPPEEIERVLDGVARFSTERPPDFDRLVGSIRRRAERVQARRTPFQRTQGAWSETGIPINVAALVIAWVDRRDPGPGAPAATLGWYLAGRIAEVARDAAAGRGGLPLLALPSYEGGWIEPVALVERVGAWQLRSAGNVAPDRLDVIAALLRLLPIRRREALVAAKALTGEIGEAVRFALGEDVPVGRSEALWSAAAASRDPAGTPAVDASASHGTVDLELARRVGVTLARLVSMRKGPTRPVIEVSTAMPVRMLAAPHLQWYTGAEHRPLVDWMAIIWPQDRRSWFRSAGEIMRGNLDWAEAQWANCRRLEPLFEPWTTIGPEATVLLAIVLQAKEPGERGLAVDAVASLLGDGRLSAHALIDGYRDLAGAALRPEERPVGVLLPQRLAASLEQLARLAPELGIAAQEIAAGTLELCEEAIERGALPIGQMAALLRVLVELRARTGRPLPAGAQAALRALSLRNGETARLARGLLA